MTRTPLGRMLRAFALRLPADEILARAEQQRVAAVLARCARVGTDVRLRQGVVVYEPERLSLGSEVDVGDYVVLRASGGLAIGDRVLIAAHAVLTTRGHPAEPPRYGRVDDAPIAIEDDVWIGAGAIVLPGVTIGRGSVVAAGAVVTKSVPQGTVVAGVPAEPIRQLEGAGT